ncbi:MAG: ECF transporter S component [Oscillospiraceae bacterium]|nr:ECF transporter S component [Oscillospiraceae bacterium]
MSKSNHNQIHHRTLWVTRTGVLIALLVVLQWATSAMGQYVTGSCVNAVLAVATLAGGLWSGVAVAALSPFCAKLFGIGPQLIQIIPAIAAGNLVFVLVLHFVCRKQKIVGLICGAAAKFGTLYLLVVQFIVPMLAENLKPQQIATFSAMFSYPQLITALIGGSVAMAILPVLKHALK